jgi:tryptophan synthase alpha chain
MNRIKTLFERKPDRVLSIFSTAGFPKLDSLPSILKSLQDNEVDMVEIGMPFSDPTADGPMIQHTNDVAIANGMTLEVLFDQLKDIRNDIHIPLVLMGYLNPVMQYGVERFLQDCAATGIDGVIVPDLPPEEYEAEYRQLFEQYGIKNIFLVTPQSTDDRIRKIDRLSDAFIYVVSTFSITGGAMAMAAFQREYFGRVKGLRLSNPSLVGFGIRDKETFDFACQYLNGAIIGTAFLNAIEDSTDVEVAVEQFVETIKRMI